MGAYQPLKHLALYIDYIFSVRTQMFQILLRNYAGMTNHHHEPTLMEA